MDLPEPVAHAAKRQLQVVTRAQLRDAGITAQEVRTETRRRWRVVLPGVVLLGEGEPTFPQRLEAALLYAGDSARIAGATAAAYFGVQAANEPGIVRVVISGRLQRREVSWLRITTSTVPDTLVTQGPLRFASRPRAVVEAAGQARTPEAARAIVIEAVQRGIADLDDLTHELHRRNRRGSVQIRQAIDQAATGAWSLPEADLAHLIHLSPVLPVAWCNPYLSLRNGSPLTCPDIWFNDVGMAVMVHSRQYHANANQWVETVEKDADLVRHGIVVLGVTPTSIREDPEATVKRIEETHATARQRPRPPVLAIPRFDFTLTG